MKKMIAITATIILFSACSNSGNNPTIAADTLNSGKPATVDTTVQPNGVTTGTVIGTDTNSMDSTFKKKSDSTK